MSEERFSILQKPLDNECKVKQAGQITFAGVILAVTIMVALVIFCYPLVTRRGEGTPKAASAQNCRQMALAGIMYGADYDDTIPVTINGWLCRMQNITDKQKTVNCPAPGTQDFVAKAAGGARTDAWPILLYPYIKSRELFVIPDVEDAHHIWSSDPHATTDKGYDPEGATYRNQDRFPFYGVNYMFLSPLRIPKGYRHRPDAMNYAVAEAHTFTEAIDPSNTIYFVESQRSMDDATRGFFVVNAPGMWKAFATNKDGYVAFSTGGAGSGDWVATNTACADLDVLPCPQHKAWNGYVNMQILHSGDNASFLDGHVRYYKWANLAQGTDYQTAIANSDGSGAQIVDKKKYLWSLDKNHIGL